MRLTCGIQDHVNVSLTAANWNTGPFQYFLTASNLHLNYFGYLFTEYRGIAPSKSAPAVYLPSPFDSIREAVFTVSPNKQYRGMVKPTTPEA